MTLCPSHLVLATLLAISSLTPRQGYGIVVQKGTIRAHGITGILEDREGGAVQNARVELFRCPANWPAGAMNGEVLRSGETDAAGKFNIQDVSGDQLRCVRFSRSGFQPLIVRIKITPLALGKMRLKMDVAN